jgi:hypothetical protein
MKVVKLKEIIENVDVDIIIIIVDSKYNKKEKRRKKT